MWSEVRVATLLVVIFYLKIGQNPIIRTYVTKFTKYACILRLTLSLSSCSFPFFLSLSSVPLFPSFLSFPPFPFLLFFLLSSLSSFLQPIFKIFSQKICQNFFLWVGGRTALPAHSLVAHCIKGATTIDIPEAKSYIQKQQFYKRNV